jgi:hypothetical protein
MALRNNGTEEIALKNYMKRVDSFVADRRYDGYRWCLRRSDLWTTPGLFWCHADTDLEWASLSETWLAVNKLRGEGDKDASQTRD